MEKFISLFRINDVREGEHRLVNMAETPDRAADVKLPAAEVTAEVILKPENPKEVAKTAQDGAEKRTEKANEKVKTPDELKAAIENMKKPPETDEKLAGQVELGIKLLQESKGTAEKIVAALGLIGALRTLWNKAFPKEGGVSLSASGPAGEKPGEKAGDKKESGTAGGPEAKGNKRGETAVEGTEKGGNKDKLRTELKAFNEGKTDVAEKGVNKLIDQKTEQMEAFDTQIDTFQKGKEGKVDANQVLDTEMTDLQQKRAEASPGEQARIDARISIIKVEKQGNEATIKEMEAQTQKMIDQKNVLVADVNALKEMQQEAKNTVDTTKRIFDALKDQLAEPLKTVLKGTEIAVDTNLSVTIKFSPEARTALETAGVDLKALQIDAEGKISASPEQLFTALTKILEDMKKPKPAPGKTPDAAPTPPAAEAPAAPAAPTPATPVSTRPNTTPAVKTPPVARPPAGPAVRTESAPAAPAESPEDKAVREFNDKYEQLKTEVEQRKGEYDSAVDHMFDDISNFQAIAPSYEVALEAQIKHLEGANQINGVDSAKMQDIGDLQQELADIKLQGDRLELRDYIEGEALRMGDEEVGSIGDDILGLNVHIQEIAQNNNVTPAELLQGLPMPSSIDIGGTPYGINIAQDGSISIKAAEIA